MGIANNVQKAGCPQASNFGNVFDKASSDAALPEVRLDEQGVQLGAAVRARQYSGEAGDHTLAFRDEDATVRNLLNRQRDRIGVREKRVAIAGIAERCTPLNRLERRLLVQSCRADGQVVSHNHSAPLRSLASSLVLNQGLVERRLRINKLRCPHG
jgi:hypothetical protein